MSKNRPHPTELKTGDIVAPPWGSKIHALKVHHVETTTMGDALGEKLNREVDPSITAYVVWGNEWFGTPEPEDPEEPDTKLIFSDGVGNPMYQRPILLESVGRESGVER